MEEDSYIRVDVLSIYRNYNPLTLHALPLCQVYINTIAISHLQYGAKIEDQPPSYWMVGQLNILEIASNVQLIYWCNCLQKQYGGLTASEIGIVDHLIPASCPVMQKQHGLASLSCTVPTALNIHIYQSQFGMESMAVPTELFLVLWFTRLFPSPKYCLWGSEFSLHFSPEWLSLILLKVAFFPTPHNSGNHCPKQIADTPLFYRYLHHVILEDLAALNK